MACRLSIKGIAQHLTGDITCTYVVYGKLHNQLLSLICAGDKPGCENKDCCLICSVFMHHQTNKDWTCFL